MSIHEVIARHQLEPADAVELVCPEIGFPKHYAIYAGTENGHPLFIANMLGGIQVIRKERLQGFLVKYVITNVERFSGRTSQRFRVIRDALKRVGERSYNLIFHNCEHFKNFVLYGKLESKQVTVIGAGAVISGGALYLLGKAFDNKGMEKAGKYILLLIIILVALFAFLILQARGDKPNENREDF